MPHKLPGSFDPGKYIPGRRSSLLFRGFFTFTKYQLKGSASRKTESDWPNIFIPDVNAWPNDQITILFTADKSIRWWWISPTVYLCSVSTRIAHWSFGCAEGKNANVLGRNVLQWSWNLKSNKLCESFSDKIGKNPVFDFRGSSANVREKNMKAARWREPERWYPMTIKTLFLKSVFQTKGSLDQNRQMGMLGGIFQIHVCLLMKKKNQKTLLFSHKCHLFLEIKVRHWGDWATEVLNPRFHKVCVDVPAF